MSLIVIVNTIAECLWTDCNILGDDDDDDDDDDKVIQHPMNTKLPQYSTRLAFLQHPLPLPGKYWVCTIKKAKLTLEQTMKTQGRSRCIALLFL